MTQAEKDRTLKNFMQEQFDFEGLLEIGFFKEQDREDYKVQAKKVCKFFGFESVYEYGARDIRCHLSYGDEQSGLGNDRPLHVNENGKLKEEPFITVIPNIYE